MDELVFYMEFDLFCQFCFVRLFCIVVGAGREGVRLEKVFEFNGF